MLININYYFNYKYIVLDSKIMFNFIKLLLNFSFITQLN